MRLAMGATKPCTPIMTTPLSSQSPACPRSVSTPASTPAAATITNVRIGRRWPEFQGANNWDGLLDPLDDTLRAEILRYGEFVQAAYTSFECDPSSPSYATCKFPKHSLLRRSGLPRSGYRVTRNLHATSGCRLPRWADEIGPAWLSGRQSSWIGYVAVCQDEEEIARLGRRDIVIAYRGTVTSLEWLENLRATLTQLPCSTASSLCSHPDPMVERGFWSLFTTPGSAYKSLRDEVGDEIRRILDAYGGDKNPLSLTITGHSLGAALAVLTAYDITTTFHDAAPMVSVISFGGPRVGNASFRRRLEERGSKVLRIVNDQDIITKVPGFVLDSDDAEDDGGGGGEGFRIPKWLLAKTGWVYADIGQELRLNSHRTANVAASHDLNVYLNLVNQLRATCPFNSEQDSWSTTPPFAAIHR